LSYWFSALLPKELYSIAVINHAGFIMRGTAILIVGLILLPSIILSSQTIGMKTIFPFTSSPENCEKNQTVNEGKPGNAPLQNTAESYSFVKIIMPTGSDLRLINDGWDIATGGSLFRLIIEVGIVLNVWYVVIGGNITVKPLTGPSIILNPGDQLTVTFGTFHIFGWGEEGDKYLLVGRFYGVTLMPT
jgi:hypothetical protein